MSGKKYDECLLKNQVYTLNKAGSSVGASAAAVGGGQREGEVRNLASRRFPSGFVAGRRKSIRSPLHPPPSHYPSPPPNHCWWSTSRLMLISEHLNKTHRHGKYVGKTKKYKPSSSSAAGEQEKKQKKLSPVITLMFRTHHEPYVLPLSIISFTISHIMTRASLKSSECHQRKLLCCIIQTRFNCPFLNRWHSPCANVRAAPEKEIIQSYTMGK